MKGLCCTVAITVAIVFLVSSALAQCARGVVSMKGKVANVPLGIDALVLVVLKTPKGDYSKTAEVTDGQFRVDVTFNTLKSWSSLTGHHCSNLPKFVEVAVKHGNQVLVQEELKFKISFESRDSLTYSLRQELILDASKKTSSNGL